MKFTRRRIIGIVAIIFIVALSAPILRWIFPPAHRHCIKLASLVFSEYASHNQGSYPSSDKGWGDALLKLGDTNDITWIRCIVGVDDDGSHLLESLKQGKDVDEALCSRIYVQGLSENSHHDIILLFDRDSEPGGDHARCRFRDRVREAITVSGELKIIKDQDWNAHVVNQRKLLEEQGFTEERIEEVYGQYK